MEMAKGNMVVLRLERKIMPAHTRHLGNFKRFCICHNNDGKSPRGFSKGDT